MDFKLVSDYAPTGDQPEAIAQLLASIRHGSKHNTLLGVTGSGKTFTVANVISQLNRPTLVLSHNKTLAAQLYGEFKNFPTTTTISPKPTYLRRIPISKRTFRSTTKSKRCV